MDLLASSLPAVVYVHPHDEYFHRRPATSPARRSIESGLATAHPITHSEVSSIARSAPTGMPMILARRPTAMARLEAKRYRRVPADAPCGWGASSALRRISPRPRTESSADAVIRRDRFDQARLVLGSKAPPDGSPASCCYRHARRHQKLSSRQSHQGQDNTPTENAMRWGFPGDGAGSGTECWEARSGKLAGKPRSQTRTTGIGYRNLHEALTVVDGTEGSQLTSVSCARSPTA